MPFAETAQRLVRRLTVSRAVGALSTGLMAYALDWLLAEAMERLLLVARLKPDALGRAEELASERNDRGRFAALRYTIFMSPNEVVFLIEGEDVDLRTREWFDDPVLSAALGSWLPLFDGPLHTAREVAASELA